MPLVKLDEQKVFGMNHHKKIPLFLVFEYLLPRSVLETDAVGWMSGAFR